MGGKSEELFVKMIKYQDISLKIMGLIVAHHLINPEGILGFIFVFILAIPIYLLSQYLIYRL